MSSNHPNGAKADAQAFGDALERYRRALIVVALDRTGRLDVAEDLAQQAIATAWEHRTSLHSPEALRNWLFRIAINCCLQWQRREEGRWVPLDNLPETSARSATVLEEVMRRETIRQARRALADVPFRSRVALLMRISGHSYEDIAEFTGVPISTVRGRIARARSRLRRNLIQRLGLYLGGKGGEQP